MTRPSDRTPGGRALSPTRARLLAILRAQALPTRLQSLEAMTGLHANTLRGHLDGLVEVGLVRRQRDPASRGTRPVWVYEATHPGEEPDDPVYAGLAATLASVIHRTTPEPEAAAHEAGEAWGQRLAREAGASGVGDDDTARHEVTRLFERLGFEPEATDGPNELRLTRCPLLEAAHQYPDVVCAVHLGLARGALAAYGGDPDGTELQPFAEPGACLLRLGPTRRA